jgi:tetratricopeptide (TPR) repeat protein/TolB-like protein
MPPPPFRSGPRKGRIVRVLLFYLGISWVVLQVVSDLREALDLPGWIGPVALILLSIGLVITLMTAWVQGNPPAEGDETATAADLSRPWEVDLRGALHALGTRRMPRPTWGRVIVGGIVAFGLLFGAAGLYVLMRQGSRLDPPRAAISRPDGVAVLPFTVHGTGVGDLREGMVDLMSTGLDGPGGLRVISSRTVLARWRELVPDSSDVDEQMALNVAQRVGARYAVLGTVVAVGRTVRLSVLVHDLEADAARLGQVQVEGPMDDVLALVDSLSLRTVGLLLRRGPDDLPRLELSSVTTTSLPALKAYLEGEALFRRGEFKDAVEVFERAVTLDSTFGLAFYRLAESYGWSENNQSGRRAETSRRAMLLVDRLPERAALLVRGEAAIARNDPAAVEILQQAVKAYPDDAEAWYALGDAYLHVRGALYGWDEARDAFTRAIELAPRFAPYRIHMIDEALDFQADSALAEERLGELERLAPASPVAHRYRLAADLAFGDSVTRANAYGVFLDSAGQDDFRSAVTNSLMHPRLFDVIGEQVMRVGMERGAPDVRAKSRERYARALVHGRGRLRDAIAVIDDPSVPVSVKINNLFLLHGLGMPVPLARLDSLTRDPDAGEAGLLVAAARAAERRGMHTLNGAEPVGRLADSMAVAGDTVGAKALRARWRALRGFALWRAGRTDEAIRTLEAAHAATGTSDAAWWLGMLQLQADRPADAVRYLRSLMSWNPNPPAAYYLGQAYQMQGESEKARQMLAFFVRNWQHADPELQFMVTDARARLARLIPDQAR